MKLPEVGKKYKLNWIDTKSDIVIVDNVKVTAIYLNKVQGKIIEYKQIFSPKQHITIDEWNKRFIYE